MNTLQEFNDMVDRVCGAPIANKPRGLMIFKCFDADGKPVWEEVAKNGTTVVGVTAMMNAWFNAGTQPGTFYLGLIDNTSFTGVSTADTAASHSGWIENTTYTGNRPAWGQGSASSGIVTNGSAVSFAITGSITIKGGFVCTAATGTSMTLYSTALLSGTQSLTNGQTLQITYTSQVNAG